MAYDNPILFHHRGVAVRKYNKVQLRVNQFEFVQFIDAKFDFNLTAKEAIEQRKALCHLCNSAESFNYKKKTRNG